MNREFGKQQLRLFFIIVICRKYYVKEKLFQKKTPCCVEKKRTMIEFHVECQATSYCYRLFLTQMADGLKIRGDKQ